MFDLKRPCNNCPFRKECGKNFKLGAERVEEIFNATSFQCHKTVDYDYEDDDIKRQGTKPQQCAGLMALLHTAEKPNTIMQVGQRLGYFDPTKLDQSSAYASLDEAIEAHS